MWWPHNSSQSFLEEIDYRDKFQSGFRPGYGTEMALEASVNEFRRETNRDSASVASPDLSTVNHDTCLEIVVQAGYGRNNLTVVSLISVRERSQRVVWGTTAPHLSHWPARYLRDWCVVSHAVLHLHETIAGGLGCGVIGLLMTLSSSSHYYGIPRRHWKL